MLTLEQRLESATEYLKLILQLVAPKDTGNLAFNSIRIIPLSPQHYQIWIGGEIAPYAVYTNTRNSTSVGWVDRAVSMAVPFIQSIMSGEISMDDLENNLGYTSSLIKDQANLRADLIEGVK